MSTFELRKSQPKVLARLEGSFLSIPQNFTVQHSLKLDVSNFADVMSAMQVAGWDQVAAQILSFLMGVCCADNWKSALASILQFCSGNARVWSAVKEKFQYISSISTLEGKTMDILSGLPNYVLQYVWEIVGTGVALVILPFMGSSAVEFLAEPIKMSISAVKFSLLKEGGTTVARCILDQLQALFLTLKKCWDTKSLDPIWGPYWDPSDFVFESGAFVQNYITITTMTDHSDKKLEELRRKDLIPKRLTGTLTLHQYIEELKFLTHRGSELIAYFQNKPGVRAVLIEAQRRLNQQIETCSLNVNCFDERVCPFGLLLFSEPGTGKTNLAKQIMTAIAKKHSWDPKLVYKWDMNVNFQSGFNHLSWAVFRDDVDHTIAPSAAGIPNHIEDYIQLVNNSAYKVEQAVADLKGSVFASPMFVATATNFIDHCAPSYSKRPDAFYRRVHCHATVAVKEAFANGTLLDVDLAADSATHDMFEIHVRTFDPSLVDAKNKGNFPFKFVKTMTFPEFMVYIHETFDHHLERERRNLNRRATAGEVCPVCYLGTDRACGHVLEGRCSFTRLKLMLGIPSWDQLEEFAAAAIVEAFNPTWFTTLGVVVGCVASIALLSRVRTALQGREANSVDGLIPTNWFRAEQVYKPGVPMPSYHTTYTKDELIQQLRNATFLVRGPMYEMWCTVVSQNLLIMPTHAGWKTEGVMADSIVVCFPNKEQRIWLNATTFRIFPSNEHYMLVKCMECRPVSGIHKKIWEVVDEQVCQFDEVELWAQELTSITTSNCVSFVRGSRCLTSDAATKHGDCGGLYIARHGPSWFIVAGHYLRLTTLGVMGATEAAIGAIITRQELKKLALSLCSELQGVAIPKSLLTRSKDFSLSKYPVVSEAIVALTHYPRDFHPLGTLTPPIAGSTMKSKIKKSLAYDYLEELEIELCGERGYWVVPQFKGSMKDQVWSSPFTDCFKNPRHNTIRWKCKWLAILDFLKDIQRLDTHGYSVLSEEQAIKGIPGSYVHKVNLNTSVGPPFNRSKRNYVFVGEDGCYMDEDVWAMYDELEAILNNGDVPLALGLATLKDEILKRGKGARVFTCLSFAFNLLCKRYFSPVKSFMRANFSFFESAVGVNMTSAECNKIAQHLKSVDTNLFMAGDVAKLDKSYEGEHWEIISLVYYAIAFCLDTQPLKTMSLVNGLKDTIFSIKNDLLVTLWNSSGNDSTVEFNSTLMSVGERYVYYLDKEDNFSTEQVENIARTFLDNPFQTLEGLDFRENVALVVYGDDNDKGFRQKPHGDYFGNWASFGLVVTNDDKTLELKFKTFEELTFLKRKFVYWDCLGMYVPPLDKKVIVRMLLYKKQQTLTDRDHMAQVMMDAMRESVYHGEEFYEKMRVLLLQIARDLKLKQRGLQFQPFTYWLEEIRKGSFCTWDPIERGPLELQGATQKSILQ